jgi:hypothetical protein
VGAERRGVTAGVRGIAGGGERQLVPAPDGVRLRNARGHSAERLFGHVRLAPGRPAVKIDTAGPPARCSSNHDVALRWVVADLTLRTLSR